MSGVKFAKRHREHFDKLFDEGKSAPEAIYADAQQLESPIHELYEWDKDKLAYQAGIDRTRQLIRVYVEVRHNHRVVEVPYGVHDPDLPARQQGYVRTVTLRDDPEKAARALQEEFARLVGLLKRIQKLALVWGLESELEDMITKLLCMSETVGGSGSGASPPAPPPS